MVAYHPIHLNKTHNQSHYSPRHAKKPPQQSFSDLMKKKKSSNFKKKPTIFDVIKEKHMPTTVPPLPTAFQNAFSLETPIEGTQLPIAPERIFSIYGSNFYKEFASSLFDYIHAETDTKKGVSITTVTIQTDNPFSRFNDMQVTIKHYDTSPHSFMIDLKTAPETTDLLAKRLTDLQIALQEKLPHFNIHLSPPSLFIIEKKHRRPQTIRENKIRKGNLRSFSCP